jgi:thiol-disulfide isomerase/thioredoxin
VQEQWLTKLESFVKEFAQSRDAPEAMLQLALAKEFAGEEKDANLWYTKLVRDFSDSPLAGKAAGAKRRLESVGKTIPLQGTTVDGKSFDLARLRGNVVLVHYWATWCQPCKQDMEVLAELQKEFARKKFAIVGVNLDSEPSSLSAYFAKQRPQWNHLYEKGGLDSRLANEMGVFTLPVMLLIDERGRVVNRQIHGPELKAEIGKLLR